MHMNIQIRHHSLSEVTGPNWAKFRKDSVQSLAHYKFVLKKKRKIAAIQHDGDTKDRQTKILSKMVDI